MSSEEEHGEAGLRLRWAGPGSRGLHDEKARRQGPSRDLPSMCSLTFY